METLISAKLKRRDHLLCCNVAFSRHVVGSGANKNNMNFLDKILHTNSHCGMVMGRHVFVPCCPVIRTFDG